MLIEGVQFNNASFHWLLLMGLLYLLGAATYAARFPERCFPGKCDIWFQSHQLFHLFVIAAAFVHFYGITEVAVKRLEGGSCREQMAADPGVGEVLMGGDGSWLKKVQSTLDGYLLPY